MKYLNFRAVEFLSRIDEELFFTWLDKIKCVSDVTGAGDSIKVSIISPVSDQCLVELIAVSFRYETDMSQLRIFLSNENKRWFFENAEAYWHCKVFQDL